MERPARTPRPRTRSRRARGWPVSSASCLLLLIDSGRDGSQRVVPDEICNALERALRACALRLGAEQVVWLAFEQVHLDLAATPQVVRDELVHVRAWVQG